MYYAPVRIKTFLDYLRPCLQEEADARTMLHIADCVHEDLKNFAIRTIDTDVVVLAVAKLGELSIDELWIAFGTDKSFRYIGAHLIAHNNIGIDPEQYRTLPMFQSLTECDTVSSFAGRGKKTCWEVWHVFPELTAALLRLSSAPVEFPMEIFDTRQTDRYFIDRQKVNPDLFVIELEICTCIYNIVNLLKSYDNIHSMT